MGGVGIGAASIVAPMYIAEVAPARRRGTLVVLYQLGIVTGILAATYVNLLIEEAQQGWRLMFGAGAVPALCFFVAILFAEESPRWLVKAGRQAEARRVLTKIAGPEEARVEIEAVRLALQKESGGLRELLTGPYRRALLIGIALAAFSQTSGVTAILSYLPEVFRSSGQNASHAFFQSVLVGVINLVFTFVAIWAVDRRGRRTLILTGTAIQTAALTTIACMFAYQAHGTALLAAISAVVAGHAMGNGAVCWVIISEIFPAKMRGVGMSIATTALWLAAYLANQFFPLMQLHLGSDGAFACFACMAALNFLFVLLLVPETKGYSLEDISALWVATRPDPQLQP